MKALPIVAGALALTAAFITQPQPATAQSVHSCAAVLQGNPNYRTFNQALDRARATGILAHNQPITIFALDNDAAAKVPQRVRNLFIVVGPETAEPAQTVSLVDQLVVLGLHRAADMKPGDEFRTNNDAVVQVVRVDGGKPVVRIGGYDMQVVAPDQACPGGLIQGITYATR